MLNPSDSNKDSGSYINLQNRIFQRVQSSEINSQIIRIIRESYEHALDVENVALSPAEKKQLRSQVLKLVLESMIEKLDNHSLSA